MNITEVDVHMIKPKDGLIAFASVVLDDEFYVGGIAIHNRLDGEGYRLAWPNRKVGDKNLKICHPIRKSIAQKIEAAITGKLTGLISRSIGEADADSARDQKNP